MYWISKLIGAMVIPPGVLIIIAIINVRAVYKNWRMLARILPVFMAILLYALSIEPIADSLLLPLENKYLPLDQSNTYNADYILVLGGGTVDHSPEYAGAAVLAADPLKRVDYAIDLYRHFELPMIFSGGIPPNAITSEASVFRQYCLKRGLPSSVLFMEPQSRNTDENFENTRRLYHPKRIILVTSAYHMPRSMLIATQHGMDSIPAPTDYKVNRVPYGILSFLPDKYAFYLSSIAIKEYVGIFFYILAGLMHITG